MRRCRRTCRSISARISHRLRSRPPCRWCWWCILRLGVNSVAELIALAKSKPGQLNYASSGVATTPHLAGALLNARAGIQLVHVPYQGSSPAITDLLAGRTQIMFSAVSVVLPHIKAGDAQGAGMGGAKARQRPARCADRGRGRPARTRCQHLVRADGAGRHAKDIQDKIARDVERRPQVGGIAGPAREDGIRAARRHAGGLHALRRQRAPEVDRGGRRRGIRK